MKLKSITDVITNSSTEVYAIATENTCKTLRESVEAILIMLGLQDEINDIEDIVPSVDPDIFDYYDWEEYPEDMTGEKFEKLSPREQYDYVCRAGLDDREELDYAPMVGTDGVVVIWKDGKENEVVQHIIDKFLDFHNSHELTYSCG